MGMELCDLRALSLLWASFLLEYSGCLSTFLLSHFDLFTQQTHREKYSHTSDHPTGASLWGGEAVESALSYRRAGTDVTWRAQGRLPGLGHGWVWRQSPGWEELPGRRSRLEDGTLMLAESERVAAFSRGPTL